MPSTRCQAQSRSTCRVHGISPLKAAALALVWDRGALPNALKSVEDAEARGLPAAAEKLQVSQLKESVAEKLSVIRDGAPEFGSADSAAYIEALGVNPDGNDDSGFNSSFVYCAEHSAVHEPGSCNARNIHKAPLAATSLVEAEEECRETGFVLAEKPEPPLSEQLLPWADKTEAMKIRDAIFLAPNRTYGESYMEPVLRKILNLEKGKGGDHDAMDPLTNERYEIKCSKVLLAKPKKPKGKKKKKGAAKEEEKKSSLFDTIVDQAHADPLARIISFEDRKSAEYDANIQNVKRDHFDQLVYVLLYAEKIQIFKMPKHEVNKEFIGAWSEKHGRADAPGKNGQFNIRHGSIEEHEKKYFHKSFTWEELVPLYKEIDAKNSN